MVIYYILFKKPHEISLINILFINYADTHTGEEEFDCAVKYHKSSLR